MFSSPSWFVCLVPVLVLWIELVMPMAGSCDFAGSAALVITDPSNGSCMYHSSKSNESEHGRHLGAVGEGLQMLRKLIPDSIDADRDAVEEILEKMVPQEWKEYKNGFKTGEVTHGLYVKVENSTYNNCAWAGICCGSNFNTTTGSCANMCQLCSDAHNVYCVPSSQTCSKWNNISTNWNQCDQIRFIRCNGSTRLNSAGLVLLALVFIYFMKLFACLL